MESRSPAAAAGWAIAYVVKVIALLVLEMIVTMAAYVYLNLYHIETFGWLVRMSRSVLDLMAAQLDFWLKASADSAYATLFGELGPKSILLLLMGLVVAALVRMISGGLYRLVTRRETAEIGPHSFHRRN
jgi:hypothetical protein